MPIRVASLSALALLLAAPLGLAQSAPQIGVVDMKRAFEEYHKTKSAAAELQKDIVDVRKDVQERFEEYKKMFDEVQTLAKKLQDPVLGNEERQRVQIQVQEKNAELKSLQTEITDFQRRREMQLREQQMRVRGGLYTEIIDVVRAKAQSEGYGLVFDSSGGSANGIPVLVFSGSAQDFTDEIVVELNKDAPANVPDGPAAFPAPEAPVTPAAE
jgi:outer membrane protein